MGTHCRPKPLTGLELNLSVHIIYIKISITWKRKKKKNGFQTSFMGVEMNHILTEKMRNRCRKFGGVRALMQSSLILSCQCRHLRGTSEHHNLNSFTVSGPVLMSSDERPWQDDTGEVWVRVCQIFHFHFVLVMDSLVLVKTKPISFQGKVTTPHSASLKSRYRPQGL